MSMREILNKLNEAAYGHENDDLKSCAMRMALAASELRDVVGKMYKIYDDNAAMNDIQPESTHQILPMSIDEWWHELMQYAEDWQKIAQGDFVQFLSDDEVTTTTLAHFFEENKDGISPEERREIEMSLKEFGEYRGGGGAAAEWTIKKL